MGGETAPSQSPESQWQGLSPRGRGNHLDHHLGARQARSIPAWAGKPAPLLVSGRSTQVYPRVGGETDHVVPLAKGGAGLSPRGRGNRAVQRRVGNGCRSIPAWAGKPGPRLMQSERLQVYPRVGGETVTDSLLFYMRMGLSPRGRGNHQPRSNKYPASGSIPAWAGKPSRSGIAKPILTVYPRVGGETISQTHSPSWPTGLSPRGRGNRSSTPLPAVGAGSIPAWAGKPWQSIR